MIIAIDGPAGSGKTTVAKLLAKRLGIFYLDTGATYRALTYLALENNVDLSSAELLNKLARNLNLKLEAGKVYLDNQDISLEVREPRIDKSISLVVVHPEVRKTMIELQRNLAQRGDFVVEGRDITTVVFPEAEHKFYLDADAKVRSRRRFAELKDKGLKLKLQEVEKDLSKRDHADKNRKVGPLKISDEARVIDTTGLTIEGTAREILKYLK
jgi:cytidylate kinase